MRGFPGGSVVKNLPAKAGDTGSIPGPRRSRMLQGNRTHTPQILSPSSVREALLAATRASLRSAGPKIKLKKIKVISVYL